MHSLVQYGSETVSNTLHSRHKTVCKAGTSWQTNGRKKQKRSGQKQRELGCKPADLQEAMKTQKFPFYDDPKQQIETDYEPNAIKILSELADAFKDDYPTQKLILKWIDGEQEHMAWEAQYLNYIDKLGYENFLTAMM